MKPESLEILKAHLRSPDCEGDVPHFYLDTPSEAYPKGNVTIGVGCLVASVSDIPALGDFYLYPEGPITLEQVREDFFRVRGAQPGMVAAYYGTLCATRLSRASIDALLEKRISEAALGMRANFYGFDSWPDGPQMGSIDFVFNIGIGNVVLKNPSYCAALRREHPDFAEAGIQCALEGEAWNARNAWKKARFDEATRITV